MVAAVDEKIVDLLRRRCRPGAFRGAAQTIEKPLGDFPETAALFGDEAGEAVASFCVDIGMLPQYLREGANRGDPGEEFVTRLDQARVVGKTICQRLREIAGARIGAVEPDDCLRPGAVATDEILRRPRRKAEIADERVGGDLCDLLPEACVLRPGQRSRVEIERLRDAPQESAGDETLAVLDQVEIARGNADPASQGRLRQAEVAPPVAQSKMDRGARHVSSKPSPDS
jgi:hypothetical protein